MYFSSQWKSSRSTMNLCFNFFNSPISVTRLFLPVLERLFFEMTYNIIDFWISRIDY